MSGVRTKQLFESHELFCSWRKWLREPHNGQVNHVWDFLNSVCERYRKKSTSIVVFGGKFGRFSQESGQPVPNATALSQRVALRVSEGFEVSFEMIVNDRNTFQI